MKKKIITVLQILLAGALLTFLFDRMENKGELLDSLKTIAVNWPFLLCAVISVFFCLSFCAFRWKLLLDAQEIRLSVWKVFELYFIGHFFNAFMLGSVGGDLIKAFFVVKAAPEKKTEAVTTIFMDRIIGLLALVALGTVIVLLRFTFFAAHTETRIAMAVIIAAFVGSVTGLFVVFRHNLLEKWAFFKRLEETTTLGSLIGKIYTAFHICFKKRGLLASTLAISLANHVSLVMCAFFLGLGLNIRTTIPDKQEELLPLTTETIVQEFGNYLTIFPIINGVAAVPATPGGLGSRELATEILMGIPEFNVPATKSVPLSLLLYLSMIFWSLAGGIIYVAHAIRQGKISAKELKELEHSEPNSTQ